MAPLEKEGLVKYETKERYFESIGESRLRLTIPPITFGDCRSGGFVAALIGGWVVGYLGSLVNRTLGGLGAWRLGLLAGLLGCCWVAWWALRWALWEALSGGGSLGIPIGFSPASSQQNTLPALSKKSEIHT